jgi:hypothetical protein
MDPFETPFAGNVSITVFCLLDPGELSVNFLTETEGLHNRNDLELIELVGGKTNP